MARKLTLEQYVSEQQIPEGMLDRAERDTEEYAKAYELRQARLAQGMTQQQVAESMGVGQNRVSALENGNLHTLKLETIERYIESIGGRLRMTVELPGREIRLS